MGSQLIFLPKSLTVPFIKIIKQIYRAVVLSGSIAVIFLHVMSPFLTFILTLVQSDLEFLRTYLSLHKSVHANTVHVLALNIPSICISMAYTDNVRDLAPTFSFSTDAIIK